MRIITTILILFYVFTGFSQEQRSIDSIKNFEWTNTLAYLPSFQGESESYKFNQGIFKHKYSKRKSFWRLKWNSRKLFTSRNKDEVLNSFEFFLANQNTKSFMIVLSKQDKDSLISMSKKKDYQEFAFYSADYQDLMKYISESDTIRININEFNTDYSKTMDAMTSVIDGAPFWITLDIKFNNNDTVEYRYVGNLYDGVEDTSVDEFLIFFNLYQNFNLFHYTPMDKYFNRENYYSVILRYIAYKENKIDRINYFKSWN